MAKNKNIFDELGNAFLIYHFRWIIIIGIILFVVLFFIINNDLNKEYQEYGYSSWSDNIKYDQWTGEIIPKNEIENYSSDKKFITNSKGEEISVARIKILLNKYEEIQGDYTSISEDRKDALDVICNILLRNYLDLDYEITFDGNNSKHYMIQIIGEYENNYYSWFSLSSELKGLVKEVFKDKYNKQNGLNN